jgi:preprotein translocase subunit Sec63
MPRKQDIELEDEEPPTIEPYKILGIEKSASADEVKAAYRKAALKHHPGMRFTSFSHTRCDLELSKGGTFYRPLVTC